MAAADTALRCLLSDLERCLKINQRALLGRDLDEIERGTVDLIHLQKVLARISDSEPGSSSGEIDGVNRISLPWETHDAAIRTFQLGRVQQVLLQRAQQSLRMVSYLLAGPHVSYAPVTTSSAGKTFMVRGG